MEYLNEIKAKELICEYGKLVYAKGLVAGNGGNLSIRTGPNEMWITPTMESKGRLTPEMLVKLDLDGNILSEPYIPSTESRMHAGLYRENPSVGAVVHAHPPVATAFACLGKNIPVNMLPEAVILFGKELAVTPFAMPGTDDVPLSVKPYAKTHRALLIGNHGALTWAASMKEAYFAMETLEQYCKIYLIAEKLIGSAEFVPAESIKPLMALHEKLLEG